MSGNEAIARGALDAGCTFYAGYPITPQNEIIAYMSAHMPGLGRVCIQAESEIAAINMVFGAAAAGARAMTSSSSPGISLKQEGISYLAGAQLPAVIVNMMRGGPGLGNIAPSQSDYFQATRGGGHGDYHQIVLSPSTVQEAYALMADAFTLAGRFRNPVMVLGDGMLGQMMEPVEVSDDGCQVSGVRCQEVAKPWALTGCKGRAPNVVKSFYIAEGDLERFNLLLQKKYAGVMRKEQRAETLHADDAKVIVVAYGSMGRVAKGAVSRMREKGKKVGLIRPITLWPFPRDVFHLTTNNQQLKTFLAVEMSYGQMYEDVLLAVRGKVPVAFLGKAGGGIPTEQEIEKAVTKLF